MLKHRTSLDVLPEDGTICLHHKKYFLEVFPSLQKTCCNPFSLHTQTVRKGLREVTSSMATTINRNTVKVGMKLCTDCRKYKPAEDNIDEFNYQPAEYVSPVEVRKQLDDTLTSIGLSPCKIAKVSRRDTATYINKKAKQVEEKSKELLCQCADIPSTSVQSADPAVESTSSDNDIDYLVQAIKDKLKVSPGKQQKLKLLTIAPKSWTIARTAEEFGVTNYLVRRARELRNIHGIIPDVQPGMGRRLPQDVIDKVVSFFNFDDISRIMPGKKDFKSVKEGGERVQKQKRLILMNLNEAFQLFKDKHPDVKLGLSKFCELRPKECVTVGARGTHSVCVCTHHQNLKLMISAFPFRDNTLPDEKITYHDLLKCVVCSVENMDCMLHRCEACPGSASLEHYILENISDEVDEIKYKQWVTTDRTTLTEHSLSRSDYIETLVEKVNKLSIHHYIAKHQSSHLQQLKDNLKSNEIIILLDFAENYSFVVQDAAQGYYWDNSQCTLHPFAVYYLQTDSMEKQLKCSSLCVISDALKHDTVAVYTFISTIMPFVKTLVPDLKKIYYFSDGAASQYKNCKNVTNLMFHNSDFNIDAEWHFFATSHGKSPCDGIGGTVKREAARASLQATTTNQILTPNDLYMWSQSHIPGINFMWISKDAVATVSQQLASRFDAAKTIPGTRDNHCYIPNENQLQVSRVSGVPGFLVNFENIHERHLSDFVPGQFVTCIYDRKWWVGCIGDTSEANDDIQVKFMHPPQNGANLFWPCERRSVLDPS